VFCCCGLFFLFCFLVFIFLVVSCVFVSEYGLRVGVLANLMRCCGEGGIWCGVGGKKVFFKC
jgi:hypothetical protein